MRYPSFIDGSNELSSVIADASRTINLMPEIVGQSGKSNAILVNRPGLSLFTEVVSGSSVRALFNGDLVGDPDYFYCVVDDNLYKITVDGGSAELINDLLESPSKSPSNSPSESPSKSPSASPSASPSTGESPSESPSISPSTSPSLSPSLSPSESPSESPSLSPSASESPSLSPSASESPSKSPSLSPSESPSLSPSASASASLSPSISPSASPSEEVAASIDAPIRYATGGTGADTLIINGGIAYSLISGELSMIAALNGITCLDCAYIGGYWIVITDDYRFFRSNVGDITTWGGTYYDYPDPQPEPLVGVIQSQGQLWFFGESRTNVWILDDTNTLGLSRLTNISVEYGLWSNATLHIFDNAIGWLARMKSGVGRVVLARNYAPEKISSIYVDNIISDNRVNLEAAYGYVTEEKGHEIYHLSIPGADTTMCYDASTQRWHERSYWTGSDDSLHLGKVHLSKEGRHFIGARNSGKIYHSNNSVYTDEGSNTRFLRRAPHIHDEEKDLSYYKFQLDMEKGLAADGVNPQMYMRYSNNGSKTWSTAIGASMGETDDDLNTVRVEWNRLGSGRDYVFEVYTTANQRQCWIDAYLDVR